jgi:hypothetical protein
MNFNIKTDRALRDLDGLLTATLCVIRMEDQYGDTNEEDKKEALETLLEYGRGVVNDATEGPEGVWRYEREAYNKGREYESVESLTLYGPAT